MKMQQFLSLLRVAVALSAGGCAVIPFEDDLDRAYKSGELSARDYYALKTYKQEAARRDMVLRSEANRARQSASVPQYTQSVGNIQIDPEFYRPAIQARPQDVGIEDRPAQNGPIHRLGDATLPSGLALDQMRKGEGTPTGRTRTGLDGTFWQEYRTWNGTTYWSKGR